MVVRTPPRMTKMEYIMQNTTKEYLIPASETMLQERESKYIPAYLVEVFTKRNSYVTQMRFYCPYCRDFHTHGLADLKPNRLTHRNAHCSSRIGQEVVHKYGYHLYYTHTNEEIKNYKKV